MHRFGFIAPDTVSGQYMISASVHLYFEKDITLCKLICMRLDLLLWVSSPCWHELRCPAEFYWNTSVRWKRSSPPRSSIPHSKHSDLRKVRSRFTTHFWTNPIFTSFFFLSVQLFSPQAFVSLRRIVATLRPADQWEHIWLWFRCQCHRCYAKHWAISPWQQGK